MFVFAAAFDVGVDVDVHVDVGGAAAAVASKRVVHGKTKMGTMGTMAAVVAVALAAGVAVAVAVVVGAGAGVVVVVVAVATDNVAVVATGMTSLSWQSSLAIPPPPMKRWMDRGSVQAKDK